ncbi:hypothetical protein EYC84_007458 [Monilinia fructicola]|uniref:cyclic pyranopterin monophosphate synthase n=1 Tax=Monilinia fructicola TaxID=38448 RepID=A0A5M9JN29_MONFR|nr:hypothetical protein EYC84_007458 [Monilinia fructicola]
MPEEGVPQSPQPDLLTTPEIVLLSSIFVSQGVTKIRLTGGEPTVRRDILPLMEQIGGLRSQGLRELCLTTNGLNLARKLDGMVEAGLTGVNLSLDTLDPWQQDTTHMNKLGAGIKLKINCVVMRGVNEREIIPFVELGRDKDVEVRFIEYMPFDGNKWSQGKMLSYNEMLDMIRQKYPTLRKVADHKNDTSKTYEIPGFVGKMGFITSMTHNFCGTCNRLRITSDGNLKKTGFCRDTPSALGSSANERELLEVIGMAVSRKKEKHAGMGELENMKNRPMILIDDKYPHSPKTLFQEIGSWPLSRSYKPSLNFLAGIPSSTSARDAHMVSISSKQSTKRTAVAVCSIQFSNNVAIPLIRDNRAKKGDVLGVARIAGIMAAKRTSDLIPLCHPIAITHDRVMDMNGHYLFQIFGPSNEFGSVEVKATVSCDGKTGVEMEALTAASTAALTIYDMCKAVDKGMRVEGLRVVRKEGGRVAHG